jgi:DNA topoisomerase II
LKLIPSCIDGLKAHQRLVMYSMFKLAVGKEIKVNQLIGMLSENNIQVDENIILSTIISLGQCFIGSNNINLIQPIGQFGTR